jgi:hypothetical protein
MKKGYFKSVVNEAYVTGQPAPKQFKVGDIVNYEGEEDGWVIVGIQGNEYYLYELGKEGVRATLKDLLAENP